MELEYLVSKNWLKLVVRLHVERVFRVTSVLNWRLHFEYPSLIGHWQVGLLSVHNTFSATTHAQIARAMNRFGVQFINAVFKI